MQPVVFSQVSRLLLVLHGLTAMALLGASTHLVVVKVQRWRGNARARLEVTYSRLLAWLFLPTYALGLFLYPHFRINVRLRGLDAETPWASNLFDFKEHLVSLGLPMVLALYFLAKRGPGVRVANDVLAVALWLMVVWGAISGLIVTGVRGI